MTSERIYKELGGIDPALIAQAAPGEKVAKEQRKWIKWVAAAACFALMTGGVLTLPGWREEAPLEST
ncbi:MAG: DUF4179 domain-containing protein, partial [Clostridia bacterium]|nr:DUF4179 domain-containing protein [Clostridia bacterium]